MLTPRARDCWGLGGLLVTVSTGDCWNCWVSGCTEVPTYTKLLTYWGAGVAGSHGVSGLVQIWCNLEPSGRPVVSADFTSCSLQCPGASVLETASRVTARTGTGSAPLGD